MKNNLMLILLTITIAINAMEENAINPMEENYSKAQFYAISDYYEKHLLPDNESLLDNNRMNYFQLSAKELEKYEKIMDCVKDITQLSLTSRKNYRDWHPFVLQQIENLAEEFSKNENVLFTYKFWSLYDKDHVELWHRHPKCTFLTGKALSQYCQKNHNRIYNSRQILRSRYLGPNYNYYRTLYGLLGLVRQAENNGPILNIIFKSSTMRNQILTKTLEGVCFDNKHKLVKAITDCYCTDTIESYYPPTFVFKPINEPFSYETQDGKYIINIQPSSIINPEDPLNSSTLNKGNSYYECLFEQKEN